jgi:hypothetical protein
MNNILGLSPKIREKPPPKIRGDSPPKNGGFSPKERGILPQRTGDSPPKNGGFLISNFFTIIDISSEGHIYIH